LKKERYAHQGRAAESVWVDWRSGTIAIPIGMAGINSFAVQITPLRTFRLNLLTV
jgi:hypothetical protein